MILRDQRGNQIQKYCATPDKIRDTLLATAKDLVGLADAYGALMVERARCPATPRPASRASTGALVLMSHLRPR